MDVDAASAFLRAQSPEQIPPRPILVLQTSARENGQGKEWILDRPTVLAKATNLVAGDLEDPCRYLSLWVVAEPTWDMPP